jgi:hypothetical protein
MEEVKGLRKRASGGKVLGSKYALAFLTTRSHSGVLRRYTNHDWTKDKTFVKLKYILSMRLS